MLRRTSISAILISLVLLTLTSMTAFAQSSGLQSITIAGTDGTTQKGLILDSGSTGQNALIWSNPQSDGNPASGDIIITGSDGNILRGLIVTDLSWTGTNPNGLIVTDRNALIWSAPQTRGDVSPTGVSTPKGMILTTSDGVARGMIVTDPNVSLRGFILTTGAINVNANALIWSAPQTEGGDAATTSGDLIFTGSDGSEYKGIIVTDAGKNGLIVTDRNALIWSAPQTQGDDSPTGTSAPSSIILIDRSGAVRGFLSTGSDFKGITFTENNPSQNGLIVTDAGRRALIWSNQ